MRYAREIARRIAFDDGVVNETLQQAREEDDHCVEDRLEQDRPDERRSIVTSDVWHRIGDQHRLADDERSDRGDHEVEGRGAVIGEEKIGRKHDEVEADEKEERRRQRLARLVQNAGADAARTGAEASVSCPEASESCLSA